MKITQFFPVKTVYAHCDIPCGVYSAEPSKIGALAVVKLAEKINGLPLPAEQNLEDHTNFVRMVQIKEREAQRCKDELLILWTDYFKPEHLEKWPDLHETFWKAAKQCSTAKRTTSVDEANKLLEFVNHIAEIFHQAEAAKKA
jgi:nickel superoxide dismutase